MPLILYDMPRSGHAHRVRLLLSLLDVEYEQVMVDMLKGEHKTAEYLELSPLGQVPILVDGDTVITDSTAALVYLAKKYAATNWLPEDPAGAAAVQRWLSAASGELYRSVVQARAGRQFRRDVDFERAEAEATRLFKWMQSELDQRTWLAAGHATIADVAMYSYLRVADEGDLDLTAYPAIMRWMEDVEKLERFEPMVRVIPEPKPES
ncbi:MAG: glutathione S-transferase [Gammaproteobacteria bacterium]|nr:MAG: glutathione S-transferase [Gammaproteobacteria bacterium]